MPAPSSDAAIASAAPVSAGTRVRAFLTVGTQKPFDRLVHTVDTWASTRADVEVFAQIGPSSLRPEHCTWTADLDPAEFQRRFSAATHVIAHAGCGTILSALDVAKPIVVMPRREGLGEHRNDHQVATAERFAELDLVRVAFDESELLVALDEIDGWGRPDEARGGGGERPRDRLIDTIRAFLR